MNTVIIGILKLKELIDHGFPHTIVIIWENMSSFSSAQVVNHGTHSLTSFEFRVLRAPNIVQLGLHKVCLRLDFMLKNVLLREATVEPFEGQENLIELNPRLVIQHRDDCFMDNIFQRESVKVCHGICLIGRDCQCCHRELRL